MLVKTFGSAVYGVEAITISVEVNVMIGKDYYISNIRFGFYEKSLPNSAEPDKIQLHLNRRNLGEKRLHAKMEKTVRKADPELQMDFV